MEGITIMDFKIAMALHTLPLRINQNLQFHLAQQMFNRVSKTGKDL